MHPAYGFIHSLHGDWSQAEQAAVAEKMAKTDWIQRMVKSHGWAKYSNRDCWGARREGEKGTVGSKFSWYLSKTKALSIYWFYEEARSSWNRWSNHSGPAVDSRLSGQKLFVKAWLGVRRNYWRTLVMEGSLKIRKSGGGRAGSVWSKYILCIYKNVTLKPIVYQLFYIII